MIKFTSVLITLLIAQISFGQSDAPFPIDPKTGWKIHTDTIRAYTVQFPAKWQGTVGKAGFFCGEKANFRDARWSVIFARADDDEAKEMWFDDEDLTTGIFEGLKKTKSIILLDGMEAEYYLETNKKWPDTHSEYIYLKTDTFWFFISNDGEKDEQFEKFYQSFKLIK